MDARIRGVGRPVVQIDQARLFIEVVSHVHIAHVGRQHGVGAEAQRRVMQAPGLIVIEARHLDLPGEQILQEIEQHHHIGLFGNLDLGDLLLVIVLVDAAHMGLLFVFRQINVLQRQVGGILGENAVFVGLGQIEPAGLLLPDRQQSIKAQFFLQGCIQFRFLCLKELRVRNGLVDGPFGQVVGEGVVVHMLLVLIRAHHVVDVKQPVFSGLHAAGPELGAVEDQLIAVFVHEILVSGAFVVTPRAEGHIRGDVDLDEAGPHLDELSGDHVGAHVFRRHFAVIQPGALPGELRAVKSVVLCLGMRPGQREVAILLQAPGHLRHIENEVGQKEDLRVPEHMALIALSHQSLCADVHPIVVRRGHQRQVVLGKAQGQQIEFRSVDGNGHPLPDLLRPGFRGLPGQRRETVRLILLELLHGIGLEGGSVHAGRFPITGGIDITELLQCHRMAHLCFQREVGIHVPA